jgi:outer membrane murein-binding lipoprotein Lpp
MLDDTLKNRLRTTARLLLYLLGALYLAGLYSTLREVASDIKSIKANVDSLESDVSSIEDDVSSIQDDVSSIRDDFEGDESTPSAPRPAHSKKSEARQVESLIAHFQCARHFEHRIRDKNQELVAFHHNSRGFCARAQRKSWPGKNEQSHRASVMPQ